MHFVLRKMQDIFVSLWSWDLVHENCADVASPVMDEEPHIWLWGAGGGGAAEYCFTPPSPSIPHAEAETGNITDGDGESMECLLQLPAYGFGYQAQHRGHQHGPSRYGTNI
ncbi:hypothetical protein Moror_15045, partial [Moniliophthora roreri MCA 2997]